MALYNDMLSAELIQVYYIILALISLHFGYSENQQGWKIQIESTPFCGLVLSLNMLAKFVKLH